MKFKPNHWLRSLFQKPFLNRIFNFEISAGTDRKNLSSRLEKNGKKLFSNRYGGNYEMRSMELRGTCRLRNYEALLDEENNILKVYQNSPIRNLLNWKRKRRDFRISLIEMHHNYICSTTKFLFVKSHQFWLGVILYRADLNNREFRVMRSYLD